MNPKTRMEGPSREVPEFLQKILAKDVKATKKLVSFMLNFVQAKSFKNHCKFLEWSAHGEFFYSDALNK